MGAAEASMYCQIILLNWVLLSGSVVYYTFRFFQQRHTAAIKARHPSLVLAFVAFLLIYIGISQPTRWFVGIFNREFDIVIALITLIPIKGIVICATARCWALYYDARFKVACEDGRWIQHINPVASESNPFIVKKGTLGNDWYMMSRIWIPIYLVSLLIVMLTTVLASVNIGMSLDIIIDLPFIVWATVVYCKIPKFRHSFRVKDEMRIVARLAIASIVGYIALFVCRMVITNATLYQITMQINAAYLAIVSASVALTFTYWVLRVSQTTSNHKIFQILSNGINDSTVQSNVSTVSLKLSDVLCQKHSFEIFIQHCLEEFCSENQLAIVELIQFRNMIGSQMNDNDADDDTTVSNGKNVDFIRLPPIDSSDDSFVKSSIVYDTQLSNAEKARFLAMKYIANGGDLTVNISHKCRYSILSSLANDSIVASNKELFVFFDTAIDELYSMTKDSFNRFKRTQQCIELVSNP